MSTFKAQVATGICLMVCAGCGGGNHRTDSDLTTVPPFYQPSSDTVYRGAPITTATAAPSSAGGAEQFAICAGCHQSNGQGVAGVYPPLAGSEIVAGKPEVPIGIILHGLNGPIKVKGQSFNNTMLALGSQLSDEQIAAILSYERSSFGNSASPVTAEQVKGVRQTTASRTTPFTAADLTATK
jgi:mono/diheme cytochrome c family protein